MVLCRALCDTYNIQSGQLTIGCDNLEAGRHAIEFQDPPRPTDNHFDILQAIHRCRSQSPISVSYKHVEGHQKEKYPSRRLDAWAKLNDSMDALAKAYWEEIHESPRLQGQPLMPNEWLATMEGRRICKNFKISFRRQFEGRRLEVKWTTPTRRKGITKAAQFQPLQIKQMDFTAIQKAWDGVSGNRRWFVAKLSSSFFPVGSYMKRMKFWPKDNCPCCLGRNETISHMLLDCPDPRVADHRTQAIETFSQHLRRIRTDSQIYRALMSLTRQALLGQTRQPHDEPDRLKDAIASQLFIGRHQFLLGRLSKEWSILQHKAYTHYAPWLSGAAWAKKVVQGIWDLTFSIWDHRNTILHTTDVHDELLDMNSTDLQILEEWHTGPTGIPDLDRYLFQGLSLDTLLAKRSQYSREWLAAVLAARDPGDPELEGGADIAPFQDTPPTNLTRPSLSDGDGEASESHSSDSSSSSSSCNEGQGL